jgi:hypothetical protein
MDSNSYPGSSRFFRGRLLTMLAEEISSLVDSMDKEANDIRQQSLKMSWYMRGGASYNDVLQMSNSERKMLSELIKENLETTKTSKLPFF